MASSIYISHLPQDHGLATKIQAQVRDYLFERDPNSPNIKVAFFILTFSYLHDPTAETTALTLLNRSGVWSIPLFYHLWPHDLLNLSKTPQAKRFWHTLKQLKGVVNNNRGDEAQFVHQIAAVLHNGPRNIASPIYDVFLSHAGEVKPFCQKLNTKLKQHGISAFLDVVDITGGPDALKFSEEIRGAIERSKVVVAVLSHHFPSKRWPVEEIMEVCRKSGGKALPVYYQISRAQCEGIVNHARSVEGREALAWLFAQPGIEHFGKHAGEQPSEEGLIQTIVHSVSSML